MSRKIVFLDVDGVICLNWSRQPKMCDVATSNLKRLVDEAGAEIVLSSTWRMTDHLFWEISEYLSKTGLRIADQTPVMERAQLVAAVPEAETLEGLPFYALERAIEIRHWLSDNRWDVASWIALDDLDLPLGDRLIRTTFEDGLTAQHTARGIARLAVPASAEWPIPFPGHSLA